MTSFNQNSMQFKSLSQDNNLRAWLGSKHRERPKENFLRRVISLKEIFLTEIYLNKDFILILEIAFI